VAGLKVFLSYAHADEKLRARLNSHLATLKQTLGVEVWDDREIRAGQEWYEAIVNTLNAAHVIILLVSADFLSSEFCQSVELKRALERHDAGEALVIPVMLRPCDTTGTALAKLQMLPKDAKPITTWPNRDGAFLDVVERLRTALMEFRPAPAAPPTRRPKKPAATPTPVSRTLERVFGPRQFASPRWFETALVRARAVCKIESAEGRGFQSGFLVRLSDFGLGARSAVGVLTASFGDPLHPASVFFEIAGERIAVKQGILRTPAIDAGTGVQLLQLAKVPSGVEPCPPAEGAPKPGPVISISHPLAGPLGFSTRGELTGVSETTVRYTAASAAGSGGCPVFDDDWNVIAMHHIAHPQEGWKGGIRMDVIQRMARAAK
jgi:hypothetical protein